VGTGPDCEGVCSGVSSDLTSLHLQVWVQSCARQLLPPPPTVSSSVRPWYTRGCAVSTGGVVELGGEKEELAAELWSSGKAPEGAAAMDPHPQRVGTTGTQKGGPLGAGRGSGGTPCRISLQVTKIGAEVPSAPVARGTVSGPLCGPHAPGPAACTVAAVGEAWGMGVRVGVEMKVGVGVGMGV